MYKIKEWKFILISSNSRKQVNYVNFEMHDFQHDNIDFAYTPKPKT